ncbi:thiol-disulfide oxidoreductase DCC family protein [Methylovulum psychrotolerans]|uniref:thiol-disulfide oxidoreductase DCC family protein n=1 Tax=Methylovulum psychrotolerans TaxID=1704499 RepID=UPI001BFF2820|nr:thiol-disulfide oxidoreductase DCC family protein [Methylovulum psychrotolerans]MBT9099617.1 thiol-disulfide oxidoreductase DCC family protein [Methylovulum psychrotolerans]
MLSPSYPPGLQCGDKVVLFDGECKLCHAWARFLIAFDKQRVFKLASVQSAAGKAILQWYGLPTHYYETMLVVDDTVMYQKSSAFIQVMLGLPWPWRLAAVLWLIPAPLRDWLYDRIALNRYRLFGKYDRCIIPTPDHLSRYLHDQ